MTLGVLRRSACGLHELIGLSHILSDSLPVGIATPVTRRPTVLARNCAQQRSGSALSTSTLRTELTSSRGSTGFCIIFHRLHSPSTFDVEEI
jgi:hypothetical protein